MDEYVLAGTRATTVVIPEGCTAIADNAFAGSGVRTVYVPPTLKTFGDGVFAGCGRILFILGDENEEAYEYAQNHGYLVIEP